MPRTRLPRRALLKLALASPFILAGCRAGRTPATTATPRWTATPRPPLRLWWWGDQEAPGLAGWLEAQLEAYSAAGGASVQALLKDTSLVLGDFQQAAESGAPPEVQSFWSGLYLYEAAWRNQLTDLTPFVPGEALARERAVLSAFAGSEYRLGWYAAPLVWLFNKAAFAQAGLDPAQPPRDWESLRAAGRALQSAGLIPIGAGLSDGFWAEAFFGYALPQVAETPGDAIGLLTGDRDWTEPRYQAAWEALAQLAGDGLLGEAAATTDHYSGLVAFAEGRAGMALSLYPLARIAFEKFSTQNLGIWTGPALGATALATRPVLDMQGFTVPVGTADPQAAVDLVRFLTRQEGLDALWRATKMLPASRAWDGTRLLQGVYRQLWSDWLHGDYLPYLPMIMPPVFWDQAMFAGTRRIAASEWSAADAAANATAIARQWAADNPAYKQRFDLLATDTDRRV